jgi:hypothetical protein
VVESRLDHLVEHAREGDEEALEAVVRGIQDRIYNLALRMLWHLLLLRMPLRRF